jgi:hypothetical protein
MRTEQGHPVREIQTPPRQDLFADGVELGILDAGFGEGAAQSRLSGERQGFQ